MSTGKETPNEELDELDKKYENSTDEGEEGSPARKSATDRQKAHDRSTEQSPLNKDVEDKDANNTAGIP